MEERNLSKSAYSIMFMVLGIWSSIPYLLPSELAILVFNKANVIFSFVYLISCTYASISLYRGHKYAYQFGITSIVMTIIKLTLGQIQSETQNPLQLATLLTMCIIFLVYSKVFKPKSTIRRARLSTLELKLEALS